MYGVSLFLQVIYQTSSVQLCFKNSSSDPQQDCLQFEERQGINGSSYTIVNDVREPGSFIHQALPNLKSTSVCKINIELLNNDEDLVVSHQFHVFRLINRPVLCTNLSWLQINVHF